LLVNLLLLSPLEKIKADSFDFNGAASRSSLPPALDSCKEHDWFLLKKKKKKKKHRCSIFELRSGVCANKGIKTLQILR
jgi:hypothetical protein